MHPADNRKKPGVKTFRLDLADDYFPRRRRRSRRREEVGHL
jgi:hypothetical protein